VAKTAAEKAALGPAAGWKQASTEVGRLADFKEMLTQHDFDPSSKWGDIVGDILDDPRFQAVTKKGPRKHAWSEWCDAKRKRMREEARQQVVLARQAFMELLGTHPDASSATAFDAATELFKGEKAWSGLPAAERQVQYDLWARKTAREEREEVEKRLKEQEKALDALLAELEGSGKVTWETTWQEAKVLLEGEPAYEMLPKRSRLDIFKRRITTLDRLERERAREAAEQQAKARREAVLSFEDALGRLTRQGRLHCDAPWAGPSRSEFDDGVFLPEGAPPAAPEAGSPSPEAPPARVDGVWVLEHSAEGKALRAAFGGAATASSARQGSGPKAGRIAEDEFDRWLTLLRREWPHDCRAVAQAADDYRLVLTGTSPEATFEGFMSRIRKETGASDAPASASASASAAGSASAGVAAASASAGRDAPARSASASRRRSASASQSRAGPDALLPRGLRIALRERPTQLHMAFTRVCADEEREEAEQRERLERRKRRYRDLLMDYFYRSDHLTVTWAEARDEIAERSAFRELPQKLRQTLFEDHMAELRRRAEASRKAREERRKQEAGGGDGGANSGNADAKADEQEQATRQQQSQPAAAVAAAGGTGEDDDDDDDDDEEGAVEEPTSASGEAAAKRARTEAESAAPASDDVSQSKRTKPQE
jgi:hypothetical protein